MDLYSLWIEIIATTWSRITFDIVVAVVAALLVSLVVGLLFRAVARRRGWPERSVQRLRRPFRVLLVVLAVWAGFDASLLKLQRHTWDEVFAVVSIVAGAWFAATSVSFLVDIGLSRYRTDVADNRSARRVRTQILLIRRVAVAVIVVVALAAILLTFPSARAAGASLLASAGVVSIIAGVAAQSTLGNVIAGIQLAFSGAIRVDDVVVADGQWGRIEEITLTYVVVHVWDDRRLVLPSNYFTTTPFENWTRTSSQLMQAVEFDLDWRVDPQGMREQLHEILGRTNLWDGRTAVLQVTDAINAVVHVRILLTAVDAPTLFDLRCFVREEMIRWMQRTAPDALPRTRLVITRDPGSVAEDPVTQGERRDRELFSGSAEADRRSRNFTGPVATMEP
ncbi:mechanosensitive ion channel domain-containing protein [Amnibacterium sp.]|uniref:mechanosensitive ion channel family protein n=1 Tax=Amnibacterium sp. TaxID=1872496 RepID=UPI002634FCA0|nr:mechanosensitive ion channel domain-containing protein [Amnibacterium sp.]MCU1474115.1 mechanosensitive ion channel protein MscS [Amnibacterium sp.]